MSDKSAEAFRTISEVADALDIPQHVLRFWETRFSQIKPMKRGGGRRYYRPEDVDLLRGIRHLLYGEGYTIKGVQRILKEQGPRFVIGCWKGTEGDNAAEVLPQADETPPLAATVGDVDLLVSPATNGGGAVAAAATGTLPSHSVAKLKDVTTMLAECRRILKRSSEEIG